MREQRIASINTGGANKGDSKDELRLRMAEHITAQLDYDKSNYVRNILNETKPGVWKRPALINMAGTVFDIV